MKEMKCFVTVGSTKFEELVACFFKKDVLKTLAEIGINEVVIQSGNGNIPNSSKLIDDEEELTFEIDQIKISIFRYKKSIREDMEAADVIIGHAGAGTCMEILELGKPFVAVINTKLMDNHQAELAEQLAMDGHLLCTTPDDLTTTLLNPALFNPIPFPKTDPTIFASFIKNLLGLL